MQRRFFLKAVAALSTVPLIKVPDFRIIEPQAILLPNEDWFATVRELSAFDPKHDAMLYRWSLFNGTKQWDVTARIFNLSELPQARDEASIVLADTLRHEGVNLRDLRPIPESGWKLIA